MSWVDAVVTSEITPLVLILAMASGIIFSFGKGWLLTPFQINTLIDSQNLRIIEANLRTEDYKSLWEIERKRAEVLADQVALVKPIHELVIKILSSLPSPPTTPKGE